MKEDHRFYAFSFFCENNLQTNLAFTEDYLKVWFARGLKPRSLVFFLSKVKFHPTEGQDRA